MLTHLLFFLLFARNDILEDSQLYSSSSSVVSCLSARAYFGLLSCIIIFYCVAYFALQLIMYSYVCLDCVHNAMYSAARTG